MNRHYAFPFCALLAVSITGCSKKNDSQPTQPARLTTPYVRLTTRFLGDQGRVVVREFVPADCSASVTKDVNFSSNNNIIFYAKPVGAERVEAFILLSDTFLKPGVIGNYGLLTDFLFFLSYAPVGSLPCVFKTSFFQQNAAMHTLTITAYDATARTITGSFAVESNNQFDPTVCSSTPQRGSIQVTGEFKSIPVPF